MKFTLSVSPLNSREVSRTTFEVDDEDIADCEGNVERFNALVDEVAQEQLWNVISWDWEEA